MREFTLATGKKVRIRLAARNHGKTAVEVGFVGETELTESEFAEVNTIIHREILLQPARLETVVKAPNDKRERAQIAFGLVSGSDRVN